MKKKELIEQLPERVKIKYSDVGIPNLYADLIKRTAKKAMYLRTDGIYEVFRIRYKKANTVKVKGKVYHYPKTEIYPCSEDFGIWASTFNNLKYAEKEYKLF